MTATEKELRRAVRIAATIMQAAGLCRYEDFVGCKKSYVDDKICAKCIERWLIAKARWELKRPAGQ